MSASQESQFQPLPSQESQFQPPPPPAPPPATATPGPRPTKMMYVGIALAAIGILVLIGGLIKIIPGGAATGGALLFAGLLSIGLSFIRLPPTQDTEAPMSALQKVTGIFFEPGRVFRNLRAHPIWLAAFLIIGVVSNIYAVAFVQRLTPERIVNFRVDKIAESGFLTADRVDQAREAQLEQAKDPIQRVGAVVTSFVGIFALFCFFSALFLLGVLAFGGRINYWQAMAAGMYAALPVTIIQKLLSLILLYVKSPDDVHPILNAETLVQDNLGVLFSPANHPALFVAATTIGLLSFYRIWLTATGLRLAGQKVSSSVAWGVTITLTVLAVIIGMIFATLFSSFMS